MAFMPETVELPGWTDFETWRQWRVVSYARRTCPRTTKPNSGRAGCPGCAPRRLWGGGRAGASQSLAAAGLWAWYFENRGRI